MNDCITISILGHEMLLSPEDSYLRDLAWHLNRDGYAQGHVKIDGRSTIFTTHRIVLARMLGRPLVSTEVGDHINGNRIDNRRCNLRITDYLGNAHNRRLTIKPHLRGVWWDRRTRRWRSAVTFKKRRIYCGSHLTAEVAAAAARTKRLELGFLRVA